MGEAAPFSSALQQKNCVLYFSQKRGGAMTDRALLELILSKVEGIEKKVDKIEERIDRIEERMDRIEERMDRIEARMDAFEERMEHMETELSAMKEKMSSMEERISSMEVSIVTMKTELLRLRLHLESNTDKNIRILAENHGSLMDTLNKAIPETKSQGLFHQIQKEVTFCGLLHEAYA